MSPSPPEDQLLPIAALILDPEGSLLETVVTPKDFQPKHIAEDLVLGAWKDDLDVERVRLYHLQK